MQLASGSHIPDGLLAANALLSENSHQGSATSTHTLHQGFGFVISHTSLGIIGTLYDGRVRSRYTGKERDAESGNDYFGARYYSSNMGRFMSPDWAAKAEPVPYATLDNPQSLNLYAYVGNNPLSRFDVDGHSGDPSHDECGCFWDRLRLQHMIISGPPPKLPSRADATMGADGKLHSQQSVSVDGRSTWQKIKGWLGDKGNGLSYAMTAFMITHSNSAMEGNKSSFDYWSKQSNEDIIKSLNTGGKEPMQVRMEGEDARVLNGNMRLSILQSRGADLGGLKPEVLPSVSLEPIVEPQVDPDIIP